MAATVIYLEAPAVPDATYEAKGVVRVDEGSLVVSGGLLGARRATAASPGTVRPDRTTTTVDDDGVMSVVGYEDIIARIEALEDALDMGMTYEDGTLVVNATLEDGTLVTGRTYEGGTLS